MPATQPTTCPHCRAPLRPTLARCTACGTARVPAGWPSPEFDRRPGYPVIDSPAVAQKRPARAKESDLRALLRHAGHAIANGGLVASVLVVVVAPLAAIGAFVGIGCCLSLGNLLLAIPGAIACAFLAYAVTLAGPLAAFLLASTNERPTFGRTIELALSRTPQLAWFLACVFFSQLAFTLVGRSFGTVGAIAGAIPAFLIGARFAVLGMAYSVVENSPFGTTVERTWDLGRGRAPLLLVAAGVPKLLQLLPGFLGLWTSVASDEVQLVHVGLGVAITAVAIVLETALAASALAVVNERRAS